MGSPFGPAQIAHHKRTFHLTALGPQKGQPPFADAAREKGEGIAARRFGPKFPSQGLLEGLA